MRRSTFQSAVVGFALAGLSFLGAASAAAAPPALKAPVVSTETNDGTQIREQQRQRQTVLNSGRSVYGPYVSSDQVRLVAD